MTITNSQTKVTYGGNGVTTAWAFPFLIQAAANIVVSITTSGITTVLSPTSYSVTGYGVPGGGIVNYPLTGPAINVGTSITIQRVTPRTQPTSMANQGAFYPAAVEGAMDWIDEQIQELNTQQQYMLAQPLTDSAPMSALPAASLRANTFLGFDVNGNPIVVNQVGNPVYPKTNVNRTNTTSYTVIDSDQSIVFNGAGTVTITLPSAATYVGREIIIKVESAFAVNSASANVIPLVGGAASATILAATAGKFAFLKSDGTNWTIMMAN